MNPPPSSAQIPFDARPLTDPVDPKQVSAFVAEMKARGTKSTTAATAIMIIVGVIALILFVPMLFILTSVLSTGHNSWLGALPLLAVVVVIVGLGAFGWMRYRRDRVARYRLSRFATANNMAYEDAVDSPPLPGMIFHLGSSRKATELIRGQSPRFVEFGNYQYTVKSGKNSTTHHWGYVAVKLDVPLPNIVLDATGNNSVFGSNLPASFHKDQRLSLEGDFDRYFSLYCPEGYERDALYLFTPDIMARFIDNAAQLDVEIVDDWMFLYTQRKVSTLDAATWAWLFGAVGALMTKFDQWARWRDERLRLEQNTSAAVASVSAVPSVPSVPSVPGTHTALPFAAPAGMLTPPPGVAQEGRRLKRSVRWVPIVVMIAFGIFWFWTRTH